MWVKWRSIAILIFLVGGSFSPVKGEHVTTVSGESLTANGITITDRVLSIPVEGAAPRQIPLDEAIEFGRTIERELGDLKARFVRVESLSETKTNLSLAEVLVYEGDKNVAREGIATQEGIDYGGSPERAIDGNTNGDYNAAQSTTHTAYIERPWWELNLQKDVSVRQIEIWNRLDDNTGTKLHERLNGTRVVLLDANRKPLWVHYIDKAHPRRMIFKVPLKGAQFGKQDIKQFERYVGVSSGTALAMTDQDIELVFVGGGKCFGKLSTWSPTAVTVDVQLGEAAKPLHIPMTSLREIWPQEVASGKLKLPRMDEAADLDNVYAKNDKGEVQRVAGKIQGRDADRLLLEIDGETRKLNWAKVAGIVFRQSPGPVSDAQYELVDFSNGHQLPGRCKSLTSDVFQMETLWNEPVEVPRSLFGRFTVQNGRMQSLVSLTPVRVEEVGYLDLVRPYRTNTSYSGGALQIGDETFSEGICAHSHSMLDYDLDGKYSRFRCEVGLQEKDGDRGHVIVRVLLDGQVKFESAVAGGDAAKEVAVDLTGGKLLQLEVDFGDGFDVADHLVWGSPTLVKAPPAESTPTAN